MRIARGEQTASWSECAAREGVTQARPCRLQGRRGPTRSWVATIYQNPATPAMREFRPPVLGDLHDAPDFTHSFQYRSSSRPAGCLQHCDASRPAASAPRQVSEINRLSRTRLRQSIHFWIKTLRRYRILAFGNQRVRKPLVPFDPADTATATTLGEARPDRTHIFSRASGDTVARIDDRRTQGIAVASTR